MTALRFTLPEDLPVVKPSSDPAQPAPTLIPDPPSPPAEFYRRLFVIYELAAQRYRERAAAAQRDEGR